MSPLVGTRLGVARPRRVPDDRRATVAGHLLPPAQHLLPQECVPRLFLVPRSKNSFPDVERPSFMAPLSGLG